MLQTLFYVPATVFGVPLFGWGLLLAVWAVATAVVLGWHVYHYGLKAESLAYVPMLALIGAMIFFLPHLMEHTATGELRGLPIRGYGVMVMLGVVGAVALAVYRGRSYGVDPELVYSLALWLFIGGIAGARAFYVIEYWRDQFVVHNADGSFNLFATLGAVINIPQGGLVVYGAWIGGALAGIFFVRRYRLPMLRLGDLVAPSLMVGLALGRIGCFLNGCCFGSTCDLPWAVRFPPQSPPYQRQLAQEQFFLHGLAFHEGTGGPAIIAGVEPGSAAEKAGIRKGDQIFEITKQTPGDPQPVQVFPTVSFLTPNPSPTRGEGSHSPSPSTGEGRDEGDAPPVGSPLTPNPSPARGDGSHSPSPSTGEGRGERDAPPVGLPLTPNPSPARGEGSNARSPARGEGSTDRSLSAAETALLGISGEGTQIAVRTTDRPEPYVWKITRADTALARSLPVHPTQLYSAVDAALLCLVLLAFEPWHTLDGQVLALWLTLHPIARFLLESIRTDEPKKYLGMSISQVVSLITLAIAASLWGYLGSQRSRVPAPQPEVIPG